MAQRVHFGGFEADLASGQLYKCGTEIPLREKSFRVLASLLGHLGEVVTREELQRRLWPNDVFVDFDNNLNTATARLREALSDSAVRSRFRETLPKRGYCFAAEVYESPAAMAESPAKRAQLVMLPVVNLSGDPAQEFLATP